MNHIPYMCKDEDFLKFTLYIHAYTFLDTVGTWTSEYIYIHTILLLCGLSPLVLLSSDLLPVAASSRREHPNIMHGVLSVI